MTEQLNLTCGLHLSICKQSMVCWSCGGSVEEEAKAAGREALVRCSLAKR